MGFPAQATGAFETIADVIQFRRLTALLMGAWLGAGILADVAVTQNFQAVDRFLQTPGSVSASTALNAAGRDKERFILRRNAGEENNWIFLNWERVELALGGLIFLLLLFGERPQKLLIALCAGMFLIVAAEHFYLTPVITELGRRVEDLPASDPESRKFWMLHGFYAGFDILKMLLGLGFAVRLAIKRRPDRDRFVREFAASMPAQANVKRG
jgi:hypothetical protein